MPWAELARADFGLPLGTRLKKSHKEYKDYNRLCIEGWQAKGFKVVIPVLQLKDNFRGIRYKATDMKDEVKRTPLPDCAIIWWSWKNAKKASWETVKDTTMPVRCKLQSLWEYFLHVRPLLNGLGLLGAGQTYYKLVPIANYPCHFDPTQ